MPLELRPRANNGDATPVVVVAIVAIVAVPSVFLFSSVALSAGGGSRVIGGERGG